MDGISTIIFDQFGEILGVVFVALAGMAMAWIRKRLRIEDLELSDRQEAWLREQARRVALLIQERYVDEPGEIKSAEAVRELQRRVDSAKSMSGVAVQRIHDEIDSVLPEIGVGRAARRALEDRLGK